MIDFTAMQMEGALCSLKTELEVLRSQQDMEYEATFHGISVSEFPHRALVGICELFIHKYKEAEKNYGDNLEAFFDGINNGKKTVP